MSSLLRILVSDWRSEQSCVSECRHCGTTVSDETASCPYCGPAEIVTYDIS